MTFMNSELTKIQDTAEEVFLEQFVWVVRHIPKLSLSEREAVAIVSALQMGNQEKIQWKDYAYLVFATIKSLLKERMIHRRVALYDVSEGHSNNWSEGNSNASSSPQRQEELNGDNCDRDDLSESVPIQQFENNKDVEGERGGEKEREEAKNSSLSEMRDLSERLMEILKVRSENNSSVIIVLPADSIQRETCITIKRNGTISTVDGVHILKTARVIPVLSAEITAKQCQLPNFDHWILTRLDKFPKLVVFLNVVSFGTGDLAISICRPDGFILNTDIVTYRLPAIAQIDKDVAMQFVSNLIEKSFLVLDSNGDRDDPTKYTMRLAVEL